MTFITSHSRNIRLPEDGAGASKHVGVLTLYKVLLINIYVVHLLGWIIKKYIVYLNIVHISHITSPFIKTNQNTLVRHST
jgi:hypothetical protein